VKRKALFVLSLILLASLAIGQTTSLNVTYTWSAPTTGSVVHHYVVQTSSNGTTWTTITAQPTSPSATVAAPVGVQLLVRVAGVDAQGRQGVFSDPSDPFVADAGQPGAPGKPVKS
jgi:hypothetical protein